MIKAFNHLNPLSLVFIYDNSTYFPPRPILPLLQSKKKVAEEIAEHRVNMFYQNYCRFFLERFPIDDRRVKMQNLKKKIDYHLRNEVEQDNLYEQFKITLEYDSSPEHTAFWIEAGVVPSTPTLNFALQHGQSIETIMLLLRHGAKPNSESLELLAVGSQSLEKYRLLTRYGARPNPETLSSYIIKKQYKSPSDEHSDDIQTIRLMMKSKSTMDEHLLDIAIEGHHPPAVIKLLVKAGAEISSRTLYSLLQYNYPPETIEFIVKEMHKMQVTELDEDSGIETQVPFLDKRSLIEITWKAFDMRYPYETTNLLHQEFEKNNYAIPDDLLNSLWKI